MSNYKKKIVKRDIPSEFDEATMNIVNRIEGNPNVMGIMYFSNNILQLCTVPEVMTLTLSSKLPSLTSQLQQTIGEIEIQDELVAYRIATNKMEIMIVNNKTFTACVVQKASKKKKTASLNKINPIVDRIMDDESVEGVIMTNKEGVPILTNINLVGATNYGLAMQRLGYMTYLSVKEIDIFDEVSVLRLTTKKFEIMVAPHPDFNIIIMQHARVNKNSTKETKIRKKNLF